MPIDTPYNRRIAEQYNQINRNKAHYLQVHSSPMRSDSFVAKSHSNPNYAEGSGYSLDRMVGSGVGVYKKSCCSGCADDKAGASPCGGAKPNEGLNSRVRMGMNLGAGRSCGGALMPNTNAGLYASGITGGRLSLRDLYDTGKRVYDVGEKVVHKGKKIAHKAKEGYDYLKKAYDVGEDIYNEVRGKGITGGRYNARAEVVKKVMREKGLSMIEASKFVKANNLY